MVISECRKKNPECMALMHPNDVILGYGISVVSKITLQIRK